MAQELEPETAIELYLAPRDKDSAERTKQAHWYRLKHVLRWCDEENITNLNTLTGRKLYQYRTWRRDDGDLNTVSLSTQLSSLRKFIRFCETIDGIEDGLYDSIVLPPRREDARDDMLEADRADSQLLAALRVRLPQARHRPPAVAHVDAVSALHSLDVEDFDVEQCLTVQRRPETGTHLKNRSSGERIIALKEDTCEVVKDWLQHNRPDVTDEYGRNPLITTEHGRVSV